MMAVTCLFTEGINLSNTVRPTDSQTAKQTVDQYHVKVAWEVYAFSEPNSTSHQIERGQLDDKH